MNPRSFIADTGQRLYAIEPPNASDAPLPTILYLSLAGDESLTLSPFNHPVTLWAHHPFRILSVTLPGHDKNQDKKKAIDFWASEMKEGKQPLTLFLDQTTASLTSLIAQQKIPQLALAGLSRGAFLATHLAARLPQTEALLGFAPMTDLTLSDSFASMADSPEVEALSVIHLADRLNLPIRYYIGNHDTLVSTRRTFDAIEAFTLAQAKKTRHTTTELIVYPSIGRHGHGTPLDTFEQGAQWIIDHL